MLGLGKIGREELEGHGGRVLVVVHPVEAPGGKRGRGGGYGGGTAGTQRCKLM